MSTFVWLSLPPAAGLMLAVLGPWPRTVRSWATAGVDKLLRARLHLFGAVVPFSTLVLTVTGAALAASALDSLGAQRAWLDNKRLYTRTLYLSSHDCNRAQIKRWD